MIDPTGRVINLVRGWAASRTPRVRGGERLKGWSGPFVVVKRISSVPWIGDPGTQDTALQTVRYSALCYGHRGESGEDEAFKLADLVRGGIASVGALTYPMTAGRAAIYSVTEDSTGPALVDRETDEPYVPVQFSVHASAQVLASII